MAAKAKKTKKKATQAATSVLSISSSDLSRILGNLSHAISSNPVLPILENILIRHDGNDLICSATNLEQSITVIEPDVKMDGAFPEAGITVPFRILNDTLKTLPQQPIMMSFSENNVNLQSFAGTYKFVSEPGRDFPEIPGIAERKSGPAVKVEFSHAELTDIISATLWAASTDELRPAMTGIFFNREGKHLVAVTTDAHKLVKYTTKIEVEESFPVFILPKMAGNTLLKITSSEKATAYIDDQNITFIVGNITLTARMIDAHYPDYTQVMPKNNHQFAYVPANDLRSSARRILIYANKVTNQGVLTFENGGSQVTLTGSNLDFDTEATEVLHIRGEQIEEGFRIGFNMRFLDASLNVCNTDEVKISMSTASRAALMEPVSDATDARPVTILLMPVMLS